MRQLIDCRLLICLLHLYNLAKTASSHIVVCPVFISHLEQGSNTGVSTMLGFTVITISLLSRLRNEVQVRSSLVQLEIPSNNPPDRWCK